MNNKMMVISEMHVYIILLPAHEPAHVHARWRVHSDYATLSSTWWPRSFDRNGQKVLQTSVIHDSSAARLRSPSGGRQKRREAKHDSFTVIHHMLQASKQEQFSPVRTLCHIWTSVYACPCICYTPSTKLLIPTSKVRTFFAKWGHSGSSQNTKKDCLRVMTWFKGWG